LLGGYVFNRLKRKAKAIVLCSTGSHPIQIIRKIAQENNYLSNNASFRKNKDKKTNISRVLNIQDPPPATKNIENNKKWAVFTYVGKETTHITKLYIKPAFSTANTLKKHLLPKQRTTEMYNNSGVYKLKCAECPLQYIGQTAAHSK
jgi:hypothetical protein